jgi:hypothetical protein
MNAQSLGAAALGLCPLMLNADLMSRNDRTAKLQQLSWLTWVGELLRPSDQESSSRSIKATHLFASTRSHWGTSWKSTSTMR